MEEATCPIRGSLVLYMTCSCQSYLSLIALHVFHPLLSLLVVESVLNSVIPSLRKGAVCMDHVSVSMMPLEHVIKCKAASKDVECTAHCDINTSRSGRLHQSQILL